MRKIIKWLFGQERDEKLWHYFLQSALAAVFIFLTFTVARALNDVLIMPSLAATVFIAFTFPHAKSTAPRAIIGGYVLAGIWGCLYFWVGGALSLNLTGPVYADILTCAITVFTVMLLMATMNMEHPPALAMAASLIFMESPYLPAIAAVISVCILSAIKWLLRRYLVNL